MGLKVFVWDENSKKGTKKTILRLPYSHLCDFYLLEIYGFIFTRNRKILLHDFIFAFVGQWKDFVVC